MKTGIQISSVRAYLTTPQGVMDSFQKCAAIGYRDIQIQWVGKDVPAEDVKKALDASGLVCAGTQDFFDVVEPSLDEVLRMNKLWGGSSVCVSRIPERYRSAEGCLAMAGEFNRMAKKVAAAGMRLLFHAVAADYERRDGKPLADILMENVSNDVAWCLDLYHVHKAGMDAAERVRLLSGRIDMVHFKDYKTLPDGTSKLAPVGQGDIDWHPIIRACEETGVPLCFAEQEEWEKDPFECLKESYDFITKNTR